MGRKSRLSANDRRESIIVNAIPLFAGQGFKGTTTKQIASAAGVSEALLYQHFSSKHEIYLAILKEGCQGPARYGELISSLEPSTSTLVHSLYFFMALVAIDPPPGDSQYIESENLRRLMLRSILENGNFAREFLENHTSAWRAKWLDCIQAAITSGDMLEGGIDPQNRWWFAQNLAMAIRLMHLPSQPVIDYGRPVEELLDQAVLFALRGFGLKEEAIQRHYNPAAMKLFLKGYFSG